MTDLEDTAYEVERRLRKLEERAIRIHERVEYIWKLLWVLFAAVAANLVGFHVFDALTLLPHP